MVVIVGWVMLDMVVTGMELGEENTMLPPLVLMEDLGTSDAPD